MTIASVSGDVDLLQVEESPQYSISTTSGDVSLKIKTAPNLCLNYDTVSGDLGVSPKYTNGRPLEIKDQTNIKLGAGVGSISLHTISGDVELR